LFVAGDPGVDFDVLCRENTRGPGAAATKSKQGQDRDSKAPRTCRELAATGMELGFERAAARLQGGVVGKER
jgi:hypothetical protein